MKHMLLAVCAGLLLSTVAVAQDVNAPIKKMLDAFNTGDVAAIKSVYAAGDISITDEVPPYHWSGASANDTWLGDLEKYEKSQGFSEARVGYATSVRTEINGDTAYVVVPTTYSWKQNGKAMTEEAHMTFVLHKEGEGWKISTWTWSGAKPRAK